MKDLNSLLSEKMQKTSETKMRLLPERQANNTASGLAGVFKILPLNEVEEETLASILRENKEDNADISEDLQELKKITSEVKAINSQAIILHGERIKKAQTLLKKYREGAFTAWLIQTYGNRQTPYNFLQYYDFYTSLTLPLQEKMMEMPKQAIYALASRAGNPLQKQFIIKEYKGEPKRLLLSKIREAFPLPSTDKRKENLSDKVIRTLLHLLAEVKEKEWSPSQYETKTIHHLLNQIKSTTQKGS